MGVEGERDRRRGKKRVRREKNSTDPEDPHLRSFMMHHGHPYITQEMKMCTSKRNSYLEFSNIRVDLELTA